MARSNISLTVDAVVFGYDPDEGISILLVERKYAPFKGGWALPGGFVKDSENLETAVQRELNEETGVTVDFLEQLYTFGAVERDPRSRIVTVAYYGLVRKSDFHLYAATDAQDAQWFHWDALPKLGFDHQDIVDAAISRLRGKVQYEPIGFNLLDEKFTIPELKSLYESILSREIDKRNFNKKLLQLDVLVELNEKVSKAKGRPSTLYRFDQKKYQDSKQKGINFTI